jgi:hypothetical protein
VLAGVRNESLLSGAVLDVAIASLVLQGLDHLTGRTGLGLW